MAVRSFHILPAGFLNLDRSILVSGTDIGMKIEVPVYSVLLFHDEGPILIDTGLNPDGLTDPAKAWGPRAALIRPRMTEKDVIENRLKDLNLTPSDIKMVILTHMHWDHVGGLRYFTRCPVVVQKAEYRFAFHPDTFVSGQYMRNHFDFQVPYKIIEGDSMLLPGLSVISTPGHSPGHQSVVIRLRSGQSHIITGDAVSTLDNMMMKIPGGNSWNGQLAVESIYRLEHLSVMLEAAIYPSHDGLLWRDFRKSPDFYGASSTKV